MSEHKLSSGLYLISTPIGNLEDITIRALRILKQVDRIYCEDTRISRKLLTHFGITTPLDTYHDHNAARKKAKIIDAIDKGEAIGLISDAGMPLISDPGYKLVVELQLAGYYVTSIPGASACLMGLQLSGLPSDQFYFGGFIPKAKEKAKNYLKKIAELEASLIFYVSPHGLKENLSIFINILGNRKAVIARELTKKFETIHHGNLEELQEIAPNLKGESVLIIAGYQKQDISIEELIDEIDDLLLNNSSKKTSEIIHKKYEIAKRKIYEFILTHQGKK